MARFNEMLDEEQRLMFRIGVHLRVIVDKENHDILRRRELRQRIQTLAEPGGIAALRTLRDVTELKVDYVFVDGEHHAKNVSRSLHIYHVRRREDLRLIVRPARAVPFRAPTWRVTNSASIEIEKLMKNAGCDRPRLRGDGVLLH